jgi:hypothetical protein
MSDLKLDMSSIGAGYIQATWISRCGKVDRESR